MRINAYKIDNQLAINYFKKPNTMFGFLKNPQLTKELAYAKLKSERSNKILLTKQSPMDNYLLDYEMLGGFVDELMKAKPMPAQSAEELNVLREQNIKKLDDKVADALFGSLNDDQLRQMNELLDKDDGTPEIYANFFANAGINLEDKIANAMQDFKTEFLGGEA